ncbi:hypothetical protein DFJ74DRAFT_432243 [Hyaloraphidium curvatum]|nr:hypothetical protein DFJ74DRAFT_432243 [Hyaloraphidium curvatum]
MAAEPVPPPSHVYKILLHSERALLVAPEPHFLTALDEKDGFVHLSVRSQLPGTLSRFFGNAEEAIILEIPYRKLLGSLEGTGREIRWEPAAGTLFPHVYGDKGILLADVGKEVVVKRAEGWNLDPLDA